MAQQNINQYVYPKLRLNIVNECMDMSLASDEVNYNQEVVFSPYLIAETYGDRLPINIDINNSGTTQPLNLFYKQYNDNNIFVSQNYYNPDNLDLLCFSSSTACDIGLTGIDNGLVTSMTGETINFTNGLYNDSLKFERLYFDRRFKMFQVTGYTSQNERFSAIPDTTLYEVVSKSGTTVGRYHELYGGFYQGFYKLFGYDYNIFPERMNKGWAVEMLLKPRLINEYFPSSGETTLNEIYPQNKDIFFYFGARAENKFYHHADGNPNCFTGYTRITSGLQECVSTCGCCNTGVTNSRCIYVYPPRSKNNQHDPHLNYGCDICGGTTGKTMTCGCDCNEQPCETCGWECFTHTCSSIPLTMDISIEVLPDMSQQMLGRIYSPDSRDSKYLIKDHYTTIVNTIKSTPLTATPSKTLVNWNDNEWWGDQGNTPMCVGYAWAHWIEDGPVTHGGIAPIVPPTTIYREAQKVDEWVGENYAGTSVRGAAKYLKSTNKISSYYWAFDVNTLKNTVLNVGPVVVGTNWYNGMFYPDRNGLIRITGRVAGGHAYVINGVDTVKQLFRIKNSWGKSWGQSGHAYISFNDMSRLIRERGEICLAVEKNF